MRKGVFISSERRINPNIDNGSGVMKKIYAQIGALTIPDKLSCDLVELPNTRMRYFFNLYKNVLVERNIDFAYIRRITPVDNHVISFLKKIKYNNPNCKILYEIPTYPYDKEHRGIAGRITTIIDKSHRGKLKYCVDKIVTISRDDIIFGIPTIKMINGISFKDIPIRRLRAENSDIHLVVIGNFAFYHGYDRMLEGLNDYYKNELYGRSIFLHFVGDGPINNYYKALVDRYQLSNFCFFYGILTGDKLTEIYDKCDIAISTLGAHRAGIFLISALKTREYLARGFPMVTSTPIDVLPEDYKYCLRVPEDESPVNIMDIIKFYDNLLLHESKEVITNKIRKFAEDNCEISKTMKPVIDYLLKG